LLIAEYFQKFYENETTEDTVFVVEPFGHELKAEWLRRNEKFSVVSKRMNGNEILAAVLQHRRGSDTEALEHGWKKR